MRGIETYIIPYVISNVLALAFLWAAWRNKRLARLLFFMLFAWASWQNGNTAANHAEAYLEYADLTFLKLYHDFILGWFKQHVVLMVGTIAFCQGLFAIAMLLKGDILRLGAIGAMLFFIAIAPFGVGSAFPCTLILAFAMYFILQERNTSFLWMNYHHKKS